MSVATRMRADQRMFGLSRPLIEPRAQRGVHGPRELPVITRWVPSPKLVGDLFFPIHGFSKKTSLQKTGSKDVG